MKKELRSGAMLLTTAVIWGFAMAAQREAARFLSPFTFNAARFTLAALSLLPLMLLDNRRRGERLQKRDFLAGAATGSVLFIASLLQQAAVGEAGAGKAGFLTALYVVLVPVLGVFMGKKTAGATWLALLLAIPALYLLCVGEDEAFRLAPSDGVLLLSAVFWALHILTTDHFAASVSALKLCTVQYAVGAALNWAFALIFETTPPENILPALWAVAYCGVLSTAVGYTLQTLGQKNCRPAVAALILSLESVFCVVAGALLLGERMSPRGYLGCGLMLLAVALAQTGALLPGRKEKKHV